MARSEPQLRLAFGPYTNRKLFADHVLRDRITVWSEFVAGDVRPLLDELRSLWEQNREALTSANEAQTEQRFIQPVLQALGWRYTVQVGLPTASGRRQPDYALFVDDADRDVADGLIGRERFRRAAAVADAKRFDATLDGRPGSGGSVGSPVAQIINYMFVTACRWGVLTNGRVWRLYASDGDLVEGGCYEVDLVSLLEGGSRDDFRYFARFFAPQAFRRGPQLTSFLDRVLEDSTESAVEVGRALERQVFAAVPLIAQGLLDDEEPTDEVLEAAFDNSLVLLYRLLFCLHAEARRLLPLGNPHYDAYSLRDQKTALALAIDSGRVFSSRSDDVYNDLRALFRIVNKGDDRLGVPEYNGGLFSDVRHPYLAARSVPDELLAPARDNLYRIAGEFVDYLGLSIRHLGTIYERLLDYRLGFAG